MIAGTPIYGFVECSNVDTVGERFRGEEKSSGLVADSDDCPLWWNMGTHRLSGGSILGQGDA